MKGYSEFDGKGFAARLSTAPGVYRMYAADDTLLYVGKARALRNRVGSYFNGSPKNARITSMLSAIRAMDADVTGLQEVRPGQFRGLRRAFGDGTMTGDARDTDGGGERAAVLVRGGRWQLESSETRWLSPTPTQRGSRGWGAHHPRVATLVRVRHGDVHVGVANTHFDHSSATARQHSADLLLQWIAESDVPWVITGDLNVQPGDAPVRTLLAAGFIDAHDGLAGGTEHGFTGATDRTRIDFVLAGPGVRVTSARIDHNRPGGRLPSDHWPVVADLAVD